MNATHDRFLRVTAFLLAAAFAVHGADHLRRGWDASPLSVLVAGHVQAVLIAVAVVLVVRRSRWAPVTAIVAGLASAVGFAYAHVLPGFWPRFSDSFVTSGPGAGVTWFSWVTAVLEIGAGLLLAFAGFRARR